MNEIQQQPAPLMALRDNVRRLDPIKKTNLSSSIIYNNKHISRIYNKSSLFRSMKLVVIMAQCFALMPLNGVTGRDMSYLKFKWFSFKMCYTFFGIFGTLFTATLYLVQFFHNDKQLSDAVNIVFFLSSSIASALFIMLARSWLKLNEKWLNIEYSMRNYPCAPNIYKRFKITVGVIMALAIGEHILSVGKNAYKSKQCSISSSDPLKAYFGVSFEHVFALMPYSGWISFFIEIFLILATFSWNFTDLFLILMCAALAERFRQLNKRVCDSENKTETFWKEIREDYTRLAILCRSLDDCICHIVTLAFGNNLFFICVQLFHTLKPFREGFETTYFLCSFGFLLGRTAVLSAYCCWINDESKIVLTYLFDIPSEEFGTEASRLIQQISFCPVAITGSKYFSVTRSLCLQVAGAIITFELILFQLGPVFLKTDDKAEVFCVT